MDILFSGIVNGLFHFIIEYIGILQAKDVEVKPDDPTPLVYVTPERVYADLGLRYPS